jgi:hypothetical protein
MLRCTVVLIVAVTVYALAAAIYHFWSVLKAQDQVLVVTPDGFLTNARQGRIAAHRPAVAFTELLSLTAYRPFLAQRKCLALQFTTPVVSLPVDWSIPRQFLSDEAIAQTIVNAYTRHRLGNPVQSSPDSVR